MGYYVFCYCLIQCYTSIFACMVVGLNVDRVEYWRPNFDSLGEAYNLRQFWGFVIIDPFPIPNVDSFLEFILLTQDL